MPLHTLYRISDGGYKKIKLPSKDKIYCLQNYLDVFGKEGLVVFADNCSSETIEKIKSVGISPKVTNEGSSGQSWRMAAEYAFKNFDESDFVYFLEDDYLHLPNSRKILLEGLQIADYVSLYDHPDKYRDPEEGGNPLVKEGGEMSRVLLTDSIHWKVTNSTTMTFACRLKTLKEDWKVWSKYTKGSHPYDFRIFKELQGHGSLYNKIFSRNRRLITPVPGKATHIETEFLAPLTDWENV